ncbi:helix-turn-helix domain-containing protein [Gaetbulibacter sp. PBL-D1]|uniref:helix-turn-helix domain-containing protein n=1 Tax=Gaetbulibacter sp. PBL-D1 TaxID=3422594 RepID=UPI003D2EB43A
MHENEHYFTVKPNNKALQQYIAYYYFNTSNTEGFVKSYIFYPHYRNAITVYKQSKISFSGSESRVTPCAKQSFEIIYTGIHLTARSGIIEAPFDKIGIVFQPLGLNHFLSQPLSTVVTETPKVNFDYFGKDFEQVLTQVYSTNSTHEKTKLLDTFFSSKITDFQGELFLKAVDLLFKTELNIQEVSNTLGINRKTLLRLFQKHLNCSPKAFSTLIKFRKAIDIYQKHKPALTDLAYQNDYYDQADFIKHFKKVTGFNPKAFFGNLSHLGTEDTFWTILNS